MLSNSVFSCDCPRFGVAIGGFPCCACLGTPESLCNRRSNSSSSGATLSKTFLPNALALSIMPSFSISACPMPSTFCLTLPNNSFNLASPSSPSTLVPCRCCHSMVNFSINCSAIWRACCPALSPNFSAICFSTSRAIPSPPRNGPTSGLSLL